jgi:aspartate-semialdehyde dehydrogenase
MRKSSLVVGVVGARGLVGRELLRLIEERRFPVGELRLYGSGRGSASFRGRSLPVKPVSVRELLSVDIAIFAVEADVAKKYAPEAAKAGVWVVDESSAFRMQPKVPLVIPEINAHHITGDTRLIAGPNCTTAALLMGVYPIHKAAPIRQIRAATYQAVSGAGREAIEEFERSVHAWSKTGRPPKATVLPHTLAFNLFPQVGDILRDGVSGEEAKIAQESRKILGHPTLRVSTTAVRVPVVRGHSIAAWVQTEHPIAPEKAKTLLATAPGVKLLNGGRASYPTPLMAAGKWPVYVGRVRRSAPDELQLWIVSDNLLKGAALNSIQIAEHLLRKRLLAPRAR